MKSLTGFPTVFAFSFRQRVKAKGWQTATFLLAVILFVLPAVLLPLIDRLTDKKDEQTAVPTPATIYVADENGTGKLDFSTLPIAAAQLSLDDFSKVSYQEKADADEAFAAAAADPASLVLLLKTGDEGKTEAKVILPEGSELTMASADAFRGFLSQTFSLLMVSRNGLSLDDVTRMATKTTSERVFEQNEDGTLSMVSGEEMTDEEIIASNSESAREIIAIMLPYLNIMLLYFLVLFYGQTTAQSVLLEKTSKLMDTFLLSVRPEAMVMGKVLAAAAACMIQVSCWFAGLIAGLFVGCRLIEFFNPDSTMMVLTILRNVGLFTEIFSPLNIIFFLLYVAGGMLLYLALSSIGGAIAGKQEDLNNTNILFTLVLVVSFLLTLTNLTGSMGTVQTGPQLYDFIPFTAILVSSSHIMTGALSPLLGVVSLAIIAAAAVLFMIIAGRVYKMFALYKGNVPKPAQIFRALTGK